GRRRFGRDAAAAAVVLVAIGSLAALAVALLPRWLPDAFDLPALAVPAWIDLTAPDVWLLLRSLLVGIAVAAAAAAVRAAMNTAPRGRLLLAGFACALAFAGLDASTKGIEMITSAVLAFLIAGGAVAVPLLVLGRNPLAWFAAPALATLVVAIPPLLASPRAAIRWNGAALAVVAIVGFIVLAKKWRGGTGAADYAD
ncbi:MAG: hypothetical protein ACRD2J_04380, partial [Thermoanaerobaculia bacterium]